MKETLAHRPSESALPETGVFGKGENPSSASTQTPPSGQPRSVTEHATNTKSGEDSGDVAIRAPKSGVVEGVVAVPDAVGVEEGRRSSRVRPKRPPLAPEIQAAVEAGARHKKVFGPMSREQSNAMVRAYHAGLVVRLKPGRKPSELTLKVAGMLQQGMRWTDIFQELGFQKLDKYERTVRKDSLRRLVKGYMRRNGLISKRPK